MGLADSLVRIENLKWGKDFGYYGDELPNAVQCGIRELVPNYDGNPNRVFDIDDLAAWWLDDRYGGEIESFDLPEELREAGKPKGSHYIRYWWRGNKAGIETYAFPTKDEVWDFVKRSISERKARFDKWETGKPKTEIDLEKVKERLFGEGHTDPDDCLYCRQVGWWDNWEYLDANGRFR